MHHSGMLPVMRELVELLFSEGLLKLLIATETVAMGLNLPARTVIFSSLTKFDGQTNRMMQATEYTQMSGRAGRRGLDSQGNSILLLNHWVDASEVRELLSTRYSELSSLFSLKLSSLLKLMRAEGTSAQSVVDRSFANWRAARARAGVEERRRRLTSELADAGAATNKLARECASDGSREGGMALVAAAEQYLSTRLKLQWLADEFEARVRRELKPWLHAGCAAHPLRPSFLTQTIPHNTHSLTHLPTARTHHTTYHITRHPQNHLPITNIPQTHHPRQ